MWINASGRDPVLTGYAQAGADVTNPPTDETAEQVAGRFLNWLAATQRRWLIVLDDLADPADLAGWWPIGPAGQVVVTTRRRDASLSAQGRARVEVDLFTADEALAYLAGRLGPERLDPQTAGLVEDLGRLPLALAQAASYLLDRDLDCAGYRRRLADRRLQLALPTDAAADDYRGTVTATWSLSIERADQLAPVGVAHPALSLASAAATSGGGRGRAATVPVGSAHFPQRTVPAWTMRPLGCDELRHPLPQAGPDQHRGQPDTRSDQRRKFLGADELGGEEIGTDQQQRHRRLADRGV